MRARVWAEIVETRFLSYGQKATMYQLFETYYDSVSREGFERDLMEKDDVILLLSDDGICGFSTLLKKDMIIDGKPVLGIYSGDTILEKKYWGSSALGRRFLWYLWLQKMKNPFRPVYWFLISKGYKTYLLMANNFQEFYPRLNHCIPSLEKKLMDSFYEDKFGHQYSSHTGVIKFFRSGCRLKSEVAAVTEELRAQIPNVDFFARMNPHWQKGEELACIAKMTLTMPVRYFIKKVIQPYLRPTVRAPIPQTHVSRVEVAK